MPDHTTFIGVRYFTCLKSFEIGERLLNLGLHTTLKTLRDIHSGEIEAESEIWVAQKGIGVFFKCHELVAKE